MKIRLCASAIYRTCVSRSDNESLMATLRFSFAQVLVSLLLVSACTTVLGCPPQREWQDYSTVSFTSKNFGLLTLTRYSNAVYAKLIDERGAKEMYQLNGGMYAYKGLSTVDQQDAARFFMLDMPVGMMIAVLAEHFKQPCSVSKEKTPFVYVRTSGKSNVEVRGNALRQNDSEIVFDLTIFEQKAQGAFGGFSGKIDFSNRIPVPADTSIVGWLITRGAGFVSPTTIITPSRPIETIRDLEDLRRIESKE